MIIDMPKLDSKSKALFNIYGYPKRFKKKKGHNANENQVVHQDDEEAKIAPENSEAMNQETSLEELKENEDKKAVELPSPVVVPHDSDLFK